MNYILKKDLPHLTTGTIFTPVSALAYAFIQNGMCHIEYAKEIVENNPDWFAPKNSVMDEIIEKEFNQPLGDRHIVRYQTAPIFIDEAKQKCKSVCKKYSSHIFDNLKQIFTTGGDLFSADIIRKYQESLNA